ncbi:MAG: DUF952 domain-containing protein [Deltaproteobacteria bacterium]|nr:DUF952 domain-containing protein [Deltaproteobacteria bacterium]MBI3389853.1 DUF952 domain-containing protein [Deltaproteobacteria bacterium]
MLLAHAIYHIVPAAELRAGVAGDTYTPARFGADGFVHCAATSASVLAVARDYFANIEGQLLVLRIDPVCLTAKLIFEAPAPIEGGGTSHLQAGDLFPHVYGPIALAAITGIAQLVRHGGEFGWPERFVPFGAFDRLGEGSTLTRQKILTAETQSRREVQETALWALRSRVHRQSSLDLVHHLRLSGRLCDSPSLR